MVYCANCEKIIGNLESPRYHNGLQVCQQCSGNLGGPVVTIEKTSKKWKSLKLWSATCFVMGLILGGFSETVGALVVLFSILTFVYACIASWWYHG